MNAASVRYIFNARNFYIVQVDASESFELCPADACNVEEQFCNY